MKIVKIIILFLACLVVFAHEAHAASGINRQINFQGKIVNKTTGVNISDASYTFVFKFYDAASGGTQLPSGAAWTESQSLAVTDGIFRASLGAVTPIPTTLDFNSDAIYLDITFNGENFGSRVRMTSVPYAFNAEKVSGLTVTTTNGTITVPNGATLTFQGTDTYVGRATTDTLTNKTVGSTGLIFSGAAVDITTGTDEALTLSANGTGDIVFATDGDSGISFSSGFTTCTALETVSGVLTCGTDDGGSGGTLQGTYDAGSAGDQIISLDATQDSIIIRNPASSGSDSTFTFKIDQLNTGISNTALYIDNRGTGSAFRIDDEVGDTTPFIVDGDGRVGIGTQAVTGSTERLLQVGSATNRGNMVAYGDVVTKGVSDITGLTNIKDIYLYDTTADSDGGKWIDWATTDQLSWYTESLDDGPSDACNIATDDRCYTSSFPRKAILVVTTDALYIFDAATNDMWMKFSQNDSGYALGIDTNNEPSSVTALNGVIYVGTNGSANSGLYVMDFVNDRMWNIDGTDRSAANVGISGRNAAVSYASDNTTAFDLSVSGTAAEWEDINDVSAVYITGSSTAISTGAATNTSPGSGQTFVGLATDSGITIINMTAQKLLQYSDVTGDDYTAVALTKRGRMYALNTTSDQLEKWINFDTDKASEINGTYDGRYDETVGPALWSSTPNIIAGAPDALEVIERGSLAEDTSDIIYVGHSLGLTEIHDHSTLTNGWSKFFDTNKQTMLMPASIDMALMMDDASGTLANDASFNNTDMTILGSPTLGVSGVRGKAMQFDNVNDYLCSDADQNGTCDVDASFNMSTTGWTLSMWFKHATTAPASGVDMLFEKCVNATPGQAIGCVAAYMTTTGAIVVGNDDDATWTQGSSYDITSTSTLTYNDNQWHQLIISRTNANDVDTYIDGNPLNLSTATGNTLTVDGSQIVTIGASCSPTTGANCAAANALNFWDGAIDDVTFSAGATTVAQMSALQARRLYNDARPLVAKKVITVTDATTVSSTTIGDSNENWIPNEFAGMFVTLTAGTGAGQTRRVTGNTATVLTVTPAFSTTPDTGTDFEIDPEALYGSTNAVYAIGVTGENPLGQARQMCIGTNDGNDGGGVTCYNHQAGPNIVADLFHGDSEQVDDYGVEWTGANYDDIRSIDLSGRALVVGSEAHIYAETSDVRLGQGLDYMSNQLFNIRAELINDGIVLTGSQALEVGFTGGADLAERYFSSEELMPGEVVMIDASTSAGVKRSTQAYQNDVLGVVSTEPGMILGENSENAYPIALVGRVPVKVSLENGMVKAGDRITASSQAGIAMKATMAGRVLGTALEDLNPDTISDCPNGFDKCGTVLMFVNLVDFSGVAISDVVPKLEDDNNAAVLAYLKLARESGKKQGSDIFAGKVTTGLLIADKIQANSIEGFEILANRLGKLEKASESGKVASNSAVVANTFADLLKENIFQNFVSFMAKVIFRAEVVFVGRPTFNADTGGFAKIKKDARQVEVVFDKEYDNLPVVTANIITEPKEDDVRFEDNTLNQDTKFIIGKLNKKGFVLMLKEVAREDVIFSWSALSVQDAKKFESKDVAPTEDPVSVETVATSSAEVTLENEQNN